MNVRGLIGPVCGIYDEMADAMKTGKPYQTRLDPPPGLPADAEGNFLPLPQWLPGQPQPENWPPHIHPPREAMENTQASDKHMESKQ